MLKNRCSLLRKITFCRQIICGKKFLWLSEYNAVPDRVADKDTNSNAAWVSQLYIKMNARYATRPILPVYQDPCAPVGPEVARVSRGPRPP